VVHNAGLGLRAGKPFISGNRCHVRSPVVDAHTMPIAETCVKRNYALASNQIAVMIFVNDNRRRYDLNRMDESGRPI
jgi:hypothetical protein